MATGVIYFADNSTPTNFSLYQNYSNPFNPTTQINFDLPKASNVIIKIYNPLGQKITTLLNAEKQSGYHKVIWDGTDNSKTKVSTGIYIYQMKADNFIAVKKMILMQ